PDTDSMSLTKVRDLRYGENPHQRAAVYVEKGSAIPRHFHQLHGKELSYNNILDIEATLDMIKEFTAPAACVIKHSNPCGVAEAKTLDKALRDAVDSDPLSAFGGIVALNRPCTLTNAKTAFEKLGFFEVLIAPSFDKQAFRILSQKQNLRLIEISLDDVPPGTQDMKRVNGGILVQDRDEKIVTAADLKIVTKKKPTKAQMQSLLFG
ncbi:MAG: bifunctional phosphoribosylaminoimidazolecarboxamide formyltransferase/inosine monophosphate cyclohydrolase, partial [Candidatus Omnitrophica bacterium CG12_big_fil_rev_8_21_14_0_65_50_5]